MQGELRIIHYPDPRLRRVSQPVPAVTPEIRELAVRMLELMRESKGVGLAAPQVGLNIRMFVMNPTGEPTDNRVYINPVLSEPDGEETAEEGCLSIPEVHVQVGRNRTMRIQAIDLEGQPIDETQTGFVARVWQHEFDHLNGVLITDRMGLSDRFQHKKVLKELEEQYAAAHPPAKPAKPANRKSSKRLKPR